MATTDLLEALPDLILLLHQDGMVLGSYGGRGVPELKPATDPVGKALEVAWPEHIAELIRRLTRQAIALGSETGASYQGARRGYDIRVTAHGSCCAVCTIRGMLENDPQQPHRRGLLRRLNDSLSQAALRGTPAAVAVIHVDGVTDIKQIKNNSVTRLSARRDDSAAAGLWSYVGRFGEDLLLFVLATDDRHAIETCIAQIYGSLRQPANVRRSVFQMKPHAGVAVLGEGGASSPSILLERACSAAAEARRTESASACFSHEHPRFRTAARPDIARELKEAIANAQIGLRYVSRHDLATGRLVARVAYLRWRHPQYGEIHPLELVRLAEVTGRAADLTRAALQRLQTDFAAFTPQWRKGVRMSFGAPKHHILHEDFVADIERFLAESVIPAERLELRISVKACFWRAASDFNSLAERGVQLVVDDLGRGMDWPLDWLGRAPIHGLQLNRGWVKAMQSDRNALNLCQAGLAIAKTYGLTPIAASVDEPAQRDILLALGCQQGSGELYRDELIPPDSVVSSRDVVTASGLERPTPFTGAVFPSG
jgi:EAL domain-containing protein (putative c-di-GMP-specific phosphodiesterase class I)/GGDEF domain-containing protein